MCSTEFKYSRDGGTEEMMNEQLIFTDSSHGDSNDVFESSSKQTEVENFPLF